MFDLYRAAGLSLTSAFYFFSVVSFTAQTKVDNDRLLAGSSRRPARQAATQQTATNSKLPFETSVVIYYGAPVKTARGTATVRSGESVKTGEPDAKASSSVDPARSVSKKISAMPAASRQAAPAPGAGQLLQPVIISYRTYQPLAFTEAAKTQLRSTKDAAGSETARQLKKETFTTVRQSSTPLVEARIAAKPFKFSAAPSKIVAAPDRIATEIIQPIIKQKPIEPPPFAAVSDPATETAPRPAASSPDTNDAVKQESASTSESIAAAPPLKEAAAAGSRGEAKYLVSKDTIKENLPPAALDSSLPAAVGGTDSLTVQPDDSSSTPAPPSVEPPKSDAASENAVPAVNVVQLNNEAVKETLDANYDDALKHLQQAIVARPDVAKFYRNLSIVYERMRRIDDALAAARTAGRLAPTTPSVLEQLCALEVVAKNVANGLSCYEGLQKIEPLDVLGQTYYAAALFHSGRIDESLAILEKTVQTTPPFPDALNALGVVYYSKKRIHDAISMFKSAVEAAPDQSQAHYNLGVAELAIGNKAAAISQYNMIKALDAKLAEQLYRGIYGDKLLYVDEAVKPKD